MLCFIISNPISLTLHKKLLLQVICQSSLLFPSLYCMTQLNYDVYWYFNVIFITVHMPKGFSRSYIFISWKKYIFKTSVFEKQENSFSSFLLLQDKTKVKVFPRLLYEALDQFEKFFAFNEKYSSGSPSHSFIHKAHRWSLFQVNISSPWSFSEF